MTARQDPLGRQSMEPKLFLSLEGEEARSWPMKTWRNVYDDRKILAYSPRSSFRGFMEHRPPAHRRGCFSGGNERPSRPSRHHVVAAIGERHEAMLTGDPNALARLLPDQPFYSTRDHESRSYRNSFILSIQSLIQLPDQVTPRLRGVYVDQCFEFVGVHVPYVCRGRTAVTRTTSTLMA